MKRLIFLFSLILSVTLFTSPAKAELTEEWVANGPGARGTHVAVDTSGNSYTISKGDTLVKFDSIGNLVWSKSINGGGRLFDEMIPDVKIGPSGNIHVVGTSNIGAYVAKFDPSGNLLWNVEGFTSPGRDQAAGMDFDAAGNVYVAGRYSHTTGGQWQEDYFITKLDPSGAVQWSTPYSYNVRERAADMAVDPSGNVYVTGWTIHPSSANYLDLLTVKFDTNGAFQWSALFDSDPYDYARNIAVGPSGTVYVSGGNNNDVTTVKYDSNGNELWRAITPDGWPYGFKVDSSGNAHIISWNWGSFSNDIVTIKYDAAGNKLWTTVYDSGGNDQPGGIDIDAAGNVFSTGTSNSSIATIKLDKDGTIVDVKTLPGNYGNDVTVGPSGNVFVTGANLNGMVVIKYSQPSPISTPGDVVPIIDEMLGSGAISNAGIANALIQRLKNAERNSETSPTSAVNMLESAINLIEAQSGGKITVEAADELIGYLTDLIAGLR